MDLWHDPGGLTNINDMNSQLYIAGWWFET